MMDETPELDAAWQRSLLAHHVESLRLALTRVEEDNVRAVLARLLSEREAELSAWPEQPPDDLLPAQ